MTPADRVDLTADLSCSKAPHSQRVRRLTSGWSGRCGQSRRISARNPLARQAAAAR